MSVNTKTAGFIGNVLGKNVGIAKGEVNILRGKMKHAKKTMQEANKGGKFAGKMGDRKIRKTQAGDRETLRGLKGQVASEQAKTFGARAKAVGGAGLVGGAAYGGKQLMSNRNEGNNDEFRPQYLASEKDELIEKVARSIIKEAAIADRLRSFGRAVKNTANRGSYRAAKLNRDVINSRNQNPAASQEVNDLLDLRSRLVKLTSKNKRINLMADKYSNPPSNKARKRTAYKGFKVEYNKFNDALDDAISNAGTKARLDTAKIRNRKAKEYSNLAQENKKLIDEGAYHYRSGTAKVQDRYERELQKLIALYGGGAGAAAYGLKKAIKSKDENAKA